jgi:hypothetical protein
MITRKTIYGRPLAMGEKQRHGMPLERDTIGSAACGTLLRQSYDYRVSAGLSSKITACPALRRCTADG